MHSMIPPPAPRAAKRHSSFIPVASWRTSDPFFARVNGSIGTSNGHKRQRHAPSKSLDLDQPHRYLPIPTIPTITVNAAPSTRTHNSGTSTSNTNTHRNLNSFKGTFSFTSNVNLRNNRPAISNQKENRMNLLAPPSSMSFRMPKRVKSSIMLQTPKDEMDEFLSSDLDLELSFASTSISSPPHPPLQLFEPASPNAMDISPEKTQRVPVPPQHQYQHQQNLFVKPIARARSATMNYQPLRDLSNQPTPDFKTGGNLLNVPMPMANPDANKSSASISSRKLARPTLPFSWISAPQLETEPFPPSPAESENAMDVDTSFQAISVPEPPSPISAAPTITQFRHSQTWIPSGVTSGPWSASPSSNGFHDLSSPAGPTRSSTLVHVFSPGEKSPAPKKMRRSISPGGHPRRRSDEYDLASPGRDVESPAADRALRRMTSHSLLAKFQASPDQSSPGPAGLNLIPSPQLAPAKRLRKPALGGAGASAMLAPPSHEGISTARHSAYGPQAPAASARLGAPPPPRRAFSAMGPPSGMGLGMFADESASSSFENSMEMSPAQAVVRRQQTRTLRRMDGGEDISIRSRDSPAVGPPPSSFKFAASPVQQQQPQQAFGSTVTESPSARYMVSSGLPGFGDNEAHGKVLPCHRVKEDGLMRIKPTTLNQLLDGSFDSAIAGFRVIDCRFDYEYQGGHIPGAINLNTNQAIEDLLLGVHAPKPSTSADNSKKTILVFHCEFSAKRAPTFAKHLRSKDRLGNTQFYPKIHYPEVYILEGGYCRYYEEFAPRCQPQQYVRMDDPVHALSRREDLDQFRRTKFGRTRSYAYGDGAGAAKLLSAGNRLSGASGMGSGDREREERGERERDSQAGPKRHTAPGGQPAVFAAGNAARTRRGPAALLSRKPSKSALNVLGGGKGLVALTEDGDTTAGEEDETDIGDSPCPPPTKTGLGFKVKKIGRAPLLRAETCGPMRLGGF